MSSLRGGPTGAVKSKQLNVNSVYSGRNLASTGKPAGKHGLQQVGKGLAAVVRRMPPPQTLPSLKAENNGQDPTINIVPQAGSGWPKFDSGEQQRTGTTVPTATAGSGPASDMRPIWAKNGPTEPVAQPPASSKEFPTLSTSAHGKESKPINAWSSGSPQIPGRTLSGSQSIDDDRQLPSRYYDSAASKPSSNYRSRFQGSSDARASQPGYFSRTDSGRERGDSTCESVGGKSDSSRSRQFSESLEGGQNGNFEEGDIVRQSRLSKELEDVKEDDKPNQNGHPAPQPEYKLLKRPQRILPEVGDDEEQNQLTKLNNPTGLQIIRRPPAGEKVEETHEAAESVAQRNYSQKKPELKMQTFKQEESVEATRKPEPVVEKKLEEVIPAPPPPENVWAKRKEERESQEKEKDRLPKSFLQKKVIDHHFPAVADTASIKVDKDLARRPVDVDFTRETLRRRAPVSNDVRNIIQNDDDRRMTRDDYAEREFSNRYQRYTREHSDMGDYRGQYQRNPRGYAREKYNDEHEIDEAEPRREEVYSPRHERHHGRGALKVVTGRGRGRGRTTVVHPARPHPHPQYQIQRRPQNDYEEENKEEKDCKEEIPAVSVTEEQVPAKEQTEETLAVSTRPIQARPANAQRGRGGGRGRGDYRRQHPKYDSDAAQTFRPKDDGNEESHDRPMKQFTRDGYSQRGRRGIGKVYPYKAQRPSSVQRSSEEPSSIEDARLKSPVVSSEGHEEWETASESSSRIQRPAKERSPEKRAAPPRKQEKSQLTAERIRSKNGQPARRTCRSPSDVKSGQTPTEEIKQEQNKTGSDGLAGLDIHNSKVVIIDDHLENVVVSDDPDEFEEVMTKRTKKQKQMEIQQKLVAEEKKKQRERERLERIQANNSRKPYKDSRKKIVDGRNKFEPSDAVESSEREGGNKETTLERNEINTTVWNSAHVAALEEEKRNEAALPSHIPSPIARPIPKTKPQESFRDDRPIVEMPPIASNIRADKYDFTFDPEIHEAQIRELQEKSSVMLTAAMSESGSVSEDNRLKERLNKVKDLWGEGDKEAGTLPSNVAKVKPQPQGGEQVNVETTKEPVNVTAGPSTVQRSPSITPFSTAAFGNISFPNYLSEMGSTGHYHVPSHNNSMLPPPNATSPPSVNIGAPYMGQRNSGRNFIESQMYNSMSQRPQSMWAPTPPVENIMPFNHTPPPVVQSHNSVQFNFNTRGNVHPPPHQMQRSYPYNSVNQQHKMAGGHHMVFAPPSMPLDVMNMSMPPPPHNANNLHLGAVGSQRNDRGPSYQSLMSNSYNGPPHQPPPQFNQPPPAVEMRFAQPPPPFTGHDMTWNPNQNKSYGSQHQSQHGGNFRSGHMNRGQASHHQSNDVWSNMSTPLLPFNNASNHNNQHNRMFQQGVKTRNSHQERPDMKRPSSAGQQPSGTSA